MAEILYKDESYILMGACFEVCNQKGFGFTEPIYQECLQHEFLIQNIPFISQPELPLMYKGIQLGHTFKPDFIYFEKIVVELKAVACLTDAHRAQTLNYLHATQFELGLLVNFGQFPKLVYERLVCNRRNESASYYEVLGNRQNF
ncbi:MAG: GxxExxY protein [Pyrinomonadaceae bacterium]